jgi:hypothetical protein
VRATTLTPRPVLVRRRFPPCGIRPTARYSAFSPADANPSVGKRALGRGVASLLTLRPVLAARQWIAPGRRTGAGSNLILTISSESTQVRLRSSSTSTYEAMASTFADWTSAGDVSLTVNRSLRRKKGASTHRNEAAARRTEATIHALNTPA